MRPASADHVVGDVDLGGLAADAHHAGYEVEVVADVLAYRVFEAVGHGQVVAVGEQADQQGCAFVEPG